MAARRVFGELQLAVFHLEQRLILLEQGVLRLGEHSHQARVIERRQRRDHRQAADELGDHAEFEDVLGLHLRQELGQRPARS